MDDAALRRRQAGEAYPPGPHRGEETSDHPGSPYAPWTARASAPQSDGTRETDDRRATPDEPRGRKHPIDPDMTAARRAGTAGGSRDNFSGDQDIERLEASLRWLRRQQGATAAPCSPSSLAAFHPARAAAANSHRGSDTPRLALPQSLEPVRMPPPPQRPSSHRVRWLLRTLIAGSVILPVGYYLFAGGSLPPMSAPQAVSFEPASIVPQSASGKSSQQAKAQDSDQVALAESSTQAVALPRPARITKASSPESKEGKAEREPRGQVVASLPGAAEPPRADPAPAPAPTAAAPPTPTA